MTKSTTTWLATALESMVTRVLLAAMGIVLFCFFTFVFLASFSSGSWLGLLIAGYVLVASVCSFRYAWKPKWQLLLVVFPALWPLLAVLSAAVP